MLDNVKGEASASERAAFEEELGVEPDTEECIALEASALCASSIPVRQGVKRKAPATSGPFPKTTKPAPAGKGKKAK